MVLLKNLKFKKINTISSYIIDDESLNTVQSFYKIAPFPAYEKNENIGDILFKGNKNDLARSVKNKFQFNKCILEAGSGTCQLSTYLSIGTNNSIYALDGTLESLQEGERFKISSKLENLKLIHGDILTKLFNDEVFDFIWCNGVLHHTKDPYKGFENLCGYLKKDGYILIGLYNRYGRLRTIIRKHLSKLFITRKNREKFLLLFDPVLRKLNKNKEKNRMKINSWLRDQYFHPIESLHTLDEVLNWFHLNKIDFVSSIPQSNYEDPEIINDKIFNKKTKTSFLDRIFIQLKMIFTSFGTEGGVFILIGKKNGSN